MARVDHLVLSASYPQAHLVARASGDPPLTFTAQLSILNSTTLQHTRRYRASAASCTLSKWPLDALLLLKRPSLIRMIPLMRILVLLLLFPGKFSIYLPYSNRHYCHLSHLVHYIDRIDLN